MTRYGRFVLTALLALCGSAAAQASPPGYHILKKIQLGGDGGWDYLTMDSIGRRLYVARGTRVMAGCKPLEVRRGDFHRLAILQNRMSDRRGRKALSRPSQKLCPQLLLEGRQTPADRNVIDAERTRRTGQTALARGGEKKTDVVPLPFGLHVFIFSHRQ